MSTDQNTDNIPQLSPYEHIRRRPGMYIGGTDRRALHHMVYEVLDHMAEEAFVGRCNHIWIELRAGNEISIRDKVKHCIENDGRFIGGSASISHCNPSRLNVHSV